MPPSSLSLTPGLRSYRGVRTHTFCSPAASLGPGQAATPHLLLVADSPGPKPRLSEFWQMLF